MWLSFPVIMLESFSAALKLGLQKRCAIPILWHCAMIVDLFTDLSGLFQFCYLSFPRISVVFLNFNVCIFCLNNDRAPFSPPLPSPPMVRILPLKGMANVNDNRLFELPSQPSGEKHLWSYVYFFPGK